MEPQGNRSHAPVKSARRPRARWLWAGGAAAVCGSVIAALVISLGSHPGPAPVRPADGASPAGGARPVPARTVGELRVTQLRVGDCLTGANMALNTSDPWPELTLAVPCSQAHTAEVFFADNTFWPQGSSFPGDGTISKDGNAACTSAFRSYVGIDYSKSMYTWANIIPDVSTWPKGDRALRCVAYYATAMQPAGVPMTGSIRGSRK